VKIKKNFLFFLKVGYKRYKS